MNSKLRGGKTPPRLLQDLLLYNPQRLIPGAYNVLTEVTLKFNGGASRPKKTPKGSCYHQWALKANQTTAPNLDSRPDSSSCYSVASYCTQCRCHLDISIDFRGEGSGVVPCGDEDWPLHHFIHTPNASQGFVRASESSIEPWIDTQHFQCSSSKCSARLMIRLGSPRIKHSWVTLLTDKSAITERAKNAMATNPERFEGHPIPSATVVLTTLRAYILNAMKSPEPRRILASNKKWLLSLGDPCSELLEYLGFARADEDWMPPRPNPLASTPFTNPLNILLDDVDKELQVLVDQQPQDDKRMAISYPNNQPATVDFQRILGCKGYKTSPASRTIDLTQEERDEHPFYGGLGSVLEFHDDLICFAYVRQTICDSSNSPYYLECLQGIAEGRKSEDLQTKVAIEASSGKISTKDIEEAYRSFGLDFESVFLNDDTIIGSFQSRVADSPRQEVELRRALNIIGLDRSSARIQHVASNTITTYEQALSWLNATEDMDDSFLESMFGVKVNDNPANEDLARTCIELIAEKRNSSALRTFLETGQLGEVEMDFGQAYARLSIDDRTIDDEVILTAFILLSQDSPSQVPDLRRALMAIAKSRNSQYLQNFLSSGMVDSEHPFSEWPVGLKNIGNTCYLNSLLQFYFTIKPLRNLVLEFNEHKMQLDHDDLGKKQVGSRKVSRKEIERAQRFVYELQKLFNSMISEQTAEVTPEQELARLTLISSSTEEHIRRQSILSTHRPSLGEINGRPVLGPSLPGNSTSAIDTAMSETSTTKDNGNTNEHDNDESSSGCTLIGEPTAASSGDNDPMVIDSDQRGKRKVVEDKENFAPPPHTDGEPEPPNRPPPVPPRQKPEDHRKALQEEVEIGAQQDVTEVIANVLFQLQCAIKPESIDESGEQLDRIKGLFFGKQKSYTTNGRGVIRTKEEFISDIKVDVASGPRDIYAALDGAFDVQEVEVGGALEPQYTTISKLPPVLQILVQRAQFDSEKKTSFKSNHHLELKDTIYLDRYMDSSDTELARRRQASWKWKKQLLQLEARRTHLSKTTMGIDMPDALKTTVAYLQEIAADKSEAIEVEPELLQLVEKAAKDAAIELSSLEGRIKTLTTNISTQFQDLRSLPYRLHSVFIHRGMVSSGHYWIYIYDFERQIWRKYNDGYVTEVKDVKEIYEAEQSTKPATPYFLVYVKEDQIPELVDAVCRDTFEPPRIYFDHAVDTEMGDGNGFDDRIEQPNGQWGSSTNPSHPNNW